MIKVKIGLFEFEGELADLTTLMQRLPEYVIKTNKIVEVTTQTTQVPPTAIAPTPAIVTPELL